MIENNTILKGTEIGNTYTGPKTGLSKPKPVTTSDDVAVEILTGSRNSYAGFVSLTDKLSTFTEKLNTLGDPASEDYMPETYYKEGDEVPEGKEIGDIKTELIGTAPTGVFKTIADGEIPEVTIELVDSLFEDEENNDKDEENNI